MDEYVNPESYIDAQRRGLEEKEKAKKHPEHPERDVMLF